MALESGIVRSMDDVQRAQQRRAKALRREARNQRLFGPALIPGCGAIVFALIVAVIIAIVIAVNLA